MNTNLRVAIVANANSIHTIRWVDWLKKRGHNVAVFSLKKGETSAYFGPEPPLNRRFILNLGRGVRKTTALLQNLIDEFKPDIVHGFFLTNHGMYASRVIGYPRIVTAMGSDVLLAPKESRLLTWLTKRTAKKASFIVSVADHLSEIISSWGINRSKIITAPLGIDIASFKPLNKRKTVIFSRGFKEIYNPMILVKAIPYVISKIPDAKFILCGDGPLLQDCRDYLNEKGMMDYVDFPGYVPNNTISNMIGEARVLVSPSLSDGTPVSVLEGLACGCVLVTSNIPANRFWTVHNKTGVLFNPSDLKELEKALVRALTDEVLMESALTEGPKIVLENADWETNISKVERLYFDLI
jgi:glycosyltransferase involved in cell wall biosynthesis